MKKFKIASVIFTLLSIVSVYIFINKISVSVFILIVAIIFSVVSLVKKEGKKLLPILLIIIDLIAILFLLLYMLGNAVSNSNSIVSTISNSSVAKITPSSSDFIQNGNIIEVTLYNEGDDISLSLEGGSKSDVCENPILTAKDSKEQPLSSISGIIKSGERFSVKWDCQNEVKLDSLYDGNLFFDYIQNGKKDTYQFYMHGWYK